MPALLVCGAKLKQLDLRQRFGVIEGDPEVHVELVLDWYRRLVRR